MQSMFKASRSCGLIPKNILSAYLLNHILLDWRFGLFPVIIAEKKREVTDISILSFRTSKFGNVILRGQVIELLSAKLAMSLLLIFL